MLRVALLLTVLYGAPALAQTPEPTGPRAVAARTIVWDTQRSRRYARTRWRVFFLTQSVVFAALAAFALTGASAALRRIIGERIASALLADAIYYIVCLILLAILLAPFSFYSDYVVEHRFGLSNETVGRWATDGLKSLAVTEVLFVPILILFYGLLRRSPERWWIWFSAASVPIVVLLLVVAPVVIDPLFNRFRPLPDGPLKTRLLDMAAREGIVADDVFEVDKSKQTNKANAYVTGLFGSKRIVLWDTLLTEFTPREVEAVMAHEMAHYVKRHVWWGVGVAVLTVTALSVIIARWAPLAVALLVKTGILRVQEAASLPIVAALAMFLLFLISPLTSAASRHMERSADRFALEVTGDGPAVAGAFGTLAAINLADPDPPKLLVFWFYSHPPITERIREAEAYGLRQPLSRTGPAL